MAFDENLAERVRSLFAGRGDVIERRMFGGLTFMVAGHMCCGVHRDELIVRLDPAAEEQALTRAAARPMDLTKRRMPGFIFVGPGGLSDAQLARWVREAVARAESLPPRAGT
jgi:hypothetical protein